MKIKTLLALLILGAALSVTMSACTYHTHYYAGSGEEQSE